MDNKSIYEPENINEENGYKDYVYKTVGKEELILTVLPPAVKKYEKSPVYFIIPGGGWKLSRSKRMFTFSKISVDLLRNHGFATVSVKYRTVSEHVKLFDIIQDCFDALGFLSVHSEELQLDTEKIAVSGHSAGGHLALMLAYADGNFFTKSYDFKSNSVKVIAAAALSPATVLHENGYPKTLAFDTKHLFNDPDDISKRKEVSPVEYVSPTSPPTALFAGTRDSLISYKSSELLYKELVKNNVEAELVLSENAGHSFEKVENCAEPSVSFDEIQKSVADFVLEHI